MSQQVREIGSRQLKQELDVGEEITLIDVREADERAVGHIGGVLLPLSELQARHSEIPRSGKVVVYCRSGGRSARVVEALQAQLGYENLWNLQGGLLAWRDEVDPSLPVA